MTHRPRVPGSTGRTYAALGAVETSGAMKVAPNTVPPMKASDYTPCAGESADGSIEYDTEEQLRFLLEGQSDLLYDLARPPSDDDDLEEIAAKYRKLSREAAFLAELVDELRPEEGAE